MIHRFLWRPTRWAALIICGLGLAGCQPQPDIYHPPPKPMGVFDVPSLIVLNIDEIGKKLGPAESERETVTAPGSDIATKVWKREGGSLQVSFHVRSRKVTEMFVSPSLTKDSDWVLGFGNIAPGDPRYTFGLTVDADDLDYYTGAKVIPTGVLEGPPPDRGPLMRRLLFLIVVLGTGVYEARRRGYPRPRAKKMLKPRRN